MDQSNLKKWNVFVVKAWKLNKQEFRFRFRQSQTVLKFICTVLWGEHCITEILRRFSMNLKFREKISQCLAGS